MSRLTRQGLRDLNQIGPKPRPHRPARTMWHDCARETTTVGIDGVLEQTVCRYCGRVFATIHLLDGPF